MKPPAPGFNSETNNPEFTRQFARACFDWADYVTTDAKRAAIASEGIAASLKLLAASSNSVPGHYYLAMNLGQLARTKSLGALKIVGQMEEEFKTVAAPRFRVMISPGPTAAWGCFIWKRRAGPSASAAKARPASICSRR